jgi:hypothetical protein
MNDSEEDPGGEELAAETKFMMELTEGRKPRGILGGNRGDTRMVIRALNHGWNIPEAVKEEVIKRAVAIVMSPNMLPRDVIAAMKVLVAADRADIARQQANVSERHGELSLGAKLVKQALASPRARDMMKQLTEQLCEGKPAQSTVEGTIEPQT